MENLVISGFADEIAADFKTQCETVKKLGMSTLCLRFADGKSIAEYSVDEFKEKLLPVLLQFDVHVSSLGSPIGKVEISDEEGFIKQKVQLETLCQICKLVDCKYIRIFSFYIPKDSDFSVFRSEVINKLQEFVAIAEKYDIVLIHENEKDIYGDVASRCLDLVDTINSKHLKLAFDFANFVQCHEDTEKCYQLLKHQIAYIHIKDAVTTDSENVLCGTGHGKIKEILDEAINKDGYCGYLTLEPHLVLFDSLQSLEIEAAKDIIKENKYSSGADGYKAQYEALQTILKQIGK